jgi:VWFA-related protein
VRRSCALVVLVLAGVAVSAQQPRPQQIPVLRSTTDIVSTDVVVRDAKGQFISGLTAKDFIVSEDGVAQEIIAFSASVGGRIVSEMAPARDSGATEGLVMPATARAPQSPGRIFIIFIDDLHLQGSDSSMVKSVLAQIRDTLLHEDDLIGIVSSGYSSIAFDVGPDPQHRRFNAAIEKTMGAAPTYQEIINAAQTIEGPSGLRANTYTALRVAHEILGQLETVNNRRKAFIYVSSGYDFNPLTDSRFKTFMDLYARPVAPGTTAPRNIFEMGHLEFSESDLNLALGELVRSAVRANVTFYPIDPRGLIAGPPAGLDLTTDEWTKFVNTSVSSLEVMANNTGGFSTVRTNGFDKAIQRIDNDMSDYYMIGYQSANPDPLKVHRRIEVKVRRAGATVTTHKNSYMIKRH